jgi:hypothetical protein
MPKFRMGDEVRKCAEGDDGQVFRIAAIGPRKPLEGEERWYGLLPETGIHLRPAGDCWEKDLVLADAA